MSASSKLEIGSELVGPVRRVTWERIEWYDSGMLSTATGKLAKVGDNIHTDDAFARGQGLSGAILDGMVSTNWCQTMLLDYFGVDFIERGALRTKYIKPIFVEATLSCHGRVVSALATADGNVEYKLDVWCEIEDGTKVVDGDARVVVGRKN